MSVTGFNRQRKLTKKRLAAARARKKAEANSKYPELYTEKKEEREESEYTREDISGMTKAQLLQVVEEYGFDADESNTKKEIYDVVAEGLDL